MQRRAAICAAIGERVQRFREDAGLTRLQLARAAGLGVESLRSIESGMGCPAAVLVILAEELDCTLDELVPV